MWAYSGYPHCLGIEVERAEAVEPDHPEPLRGRQMGEQRHQVGLAGVLGRVLAGEAGQEVPVRLDEVFVTPAQKLNVLERGDTFPHQLQHAGAHALDAWLDARHSSFVELPTCSRFRFALVS